MTVGIFLSLLNGLHFRHTLDIIFEFIPQMIFIMSLFGYMVFLIFYKWCIDWSNSPHGPPFLLNVMIQMFLSPIQVEPDNKVYDIEGNSQVWQFLNFLILSACHSRRFACFGYRFYSYNVVAEAFDPQESP